MPYDAETLRAINNDLKRLQDSLTQSFKDTEVEIMVGKYKGFSGTIDHVQIFGNHLRFCITVKDGEQNGKVGRFLEHDGEFRCYRPITEFKYKI